MIEYICDGQFQQSIKGFFVPTMFGPDGQESNRSKFQEPFAGWWILVYSTPDAAVKAIGVDAGEDTFLLTQIQASEEFITRATEEGCRLALDAHRGEDDNMHFFEITGANLPAWN